MIKIRIDNHEIAVAEGTSVAAAMLNSDPRSLRRSVAGELRGPLCGMGVCFECLVTINGRARQRSCMVIAAEGMEVVTDA